MSVFRFTTSHYLCCIFKLFLILVFQYIREMDVSSILQNLNMLGSLIMHICSIMSITMYICLSSRTRLFIYDTRRWILSSGYCRRSAIVLSVLLRYTDSDCPFGIFKLFLLIQQLVGIVDSGRCLATNTVQHLLYGIYIWGNGMSLKSENDFL